MVFLGTYHSKLRICRPFLQNGFWAGRGAGGEMPSFEAADFMETEMGNVAS
jgi:hypothetical protein